MSEEEISTKLHELANAEALSDEDKKNANTAKALLQLYAKLNASTPE